MNLDKQLQRLADRARGAIIPEVDVTHAVITSLRVSRPSPSFAWDRPLMWAAGLSSAVAVCLVITALLLYSGTSTDPLNEVIETVSWATLQ